jgi:4-amino-4-deoxy-L-arabinose transferase-like glycosyltransferase
MRFQHHPHSAAFYLLVAGAFAFLTVPRMAQPGMFLDGLTYAVISRNLAQGLGSFWFPFYTSSVYPQFHEQPPLGFALQGAAFAVLGDHLAVERVYSVLCGALTAVLTMTLWRRTADKPGYDWLPIVFWLLPSAVTWTIVNNMLETTQAVFTTLSVLSFVVSLQAARARWLWASCSGLCVVGAVLTKGPAGFFPLAAPVVAAVLLRNHRRAAFRSGAIMGAIVVAAVAILSRADASSVALRAYWDQQVLATVSGTRGGARWSDLLKHLAGGVLLRMAAVTGLVTLYGWVAGVGRTEPISRQNPWTWFFLALALCASLPIAISPRVVGHYLVPSVPLYALACAGLALSVVAPALERVRSGAWGIRAVGALGLGLLATAVAIPLLGGALEKRDSDWMAEYRALAPFIGPGTTIGSCHAMRQEWGLHAYMQRFFSVSLDTEHGPTERQFLQLREQPCDAPSNCESVVVTRRLALLACR